MTDQQIDNSIDKQYLDVDWNYYVGFGLFILLIPVVYFFNVFWDYLAGRAFSLSFTRTITFILLFVFGLLLLIYKLKKLKLEVVKTTLTNTELIRIIKKLARYNDWLIDVSIDRLMILKIGNNHNSFAKGEQITIIFDERNLLLNSRCAPDKLKLLNCFSTKKVNITRIKNEISKSTQ